MSRISPGKQVKTKGRWAMDLRSGGDWHGQRECLTRSCHHPTSSGLTLRVPALHVVPKDAEHPDFHHRTSRVQSHRWAKGCHAHPSDNAGDYGGMAVGLSSKLCNLFTVQKILSSFLGYLFDTDGSTVHFSHPHTRTYTHTFYLYVGMIDDR